MDAPREPNNTNLTENCGEYLTFMNREKEKFSSIFPEIVSAVVGSPKFANAPDIARRIKRLMEYNSAGGNKARGLMTVRAYQALEDPEKITKNTLRLARILGWCVELFQTSLVLLDDMADNSPTRRGSVCWYRLPDVGFFPAINDSFLLLTVVFNMLKDNFGDRPCYPEMMYTFIEALEDLCIGQYELPPNDYSQFTMEYYKSNSNNKFTYYTFKLPIRLSLLLVNKPVNNVFDYVDDILVDMGILHSMRCDYADCFGDESESGKAGTDIQGGKCTWLAVTALQRCSTAQRAQFSACYGGAGAARVRRVKRLYERLQLPALYLEAERAAYEDIVKRIQKLPADCKIPSVLILDLVRMITEMPVD